MLLMYKNLGIKSIHFHEIMFDIRREMANKYNCTAATDFETV